VNSYIAHAVEGEKLNSWYPLLSIVATNASKHVCCHNLSARRGVDSAGMRRRSISASTVYRSASVALLGRSSCTSMRWTAGQEVAGWQVSETVCTIAPHSSLTYALPRGERD